MGADGVAPPELSQLIYSQPRYYLRYIHPLKEHRANFDSYQRGMVFRFIVSIDAPIDRFYNAYRPHVNTSVFLIARLRILGGRWELNP